MKKIIPLLIVVLLVVGGVIYLLSSDTAVAPRGDKRLATVGGEYVATDDFIERLNAVPSRIILDQGRQVTANALFEQMLRDALVKDAARQEGIYKSDVYKERLAALKDNLAREIFLQERLAGTVTDADVTALYQERFLDNPDANKDFRVRHIVVADERTAWDVISRLKKGEAFGALMEEFSNQPRNTEVTQARQQQVLGLFASVARELEKGEFSQTPVQSPYGWHVIQLQDVQDTETPPIERVAPQLRQQLVAAKVDSLLQSLRNTTEIEINEEGFNKLVQGATPAQNTAPAEESSEPVE